MKNIFALIMIALTAACASAPPQIEPPPATFVENTRATERLMTDQKFQEGLDVAMASGSTLEPFVRELAEVPPTDESRVLMTALLEEEAKRRPLTASPLIVAPPPPATQLSYEPTPLAESRTAPAPGFWNENRVVGALIGVVVLGLVMAKTDYKLVITAP